MIRYFPKAYPDELLYSIVSRYNEKSVTRNVAGTLKQLFGTENMIMSVDCPSRIGELSRRLHDTYTEGEIIDKHTLYPLFKIFLDEERRCDLYDKMVGNYAKDIHMQSGIMASRIKMLQHLRYCPKCLEKDEAKYGEAYWHRSHNVNGVFYCHKHEVLLREKYPNSKEYVYEKARRELTSLKGIKDYEDINGTVINKQICEQTEQRLKEIARSVNMLLNTDTRQQNICLSQVYKLYLYLLEKQNLLTNSHRIQGRYIKEALNRYYGKETLDILELDLDEDKEYTWLKGMFGKKKKATHPLMHIVFINWLYNGEIINFLEDLQHEIASPRERYWPCLNPAAEHYKQHIIKGYTLSYNAKLKYHVATFECECGYIYTRKIEDIDNIYQKSRVKQYGGIWEAKLKELLTEKENTIRSISKQLKVDRSTVKAYAEKIQTIGIKNTSQDIEKIERIRHIHQKTGKIKKVLQDFLQTNKVSKAELRRRFSKEYSWMLSNSPEELDEILKGCTWQGNGRVDWNERDTITCKLVEKEIKDLRKNNSKISISKIGKNIGRLYMLEKHLDKLPKTAKLLNCIKPNTNAEGLLT